MKMPTRPTLATYFALLAGFVPALSGAQGVDAIHVSGSGDQVITDVLVRSDGSQYLSGYYTGALSLGCSSSCPRAANGEDGFVIRVDKQGQSMWEEPVYIAGPGNQRANAIVLSEDGKDLLVVGNIEGEVNLGSTTIGELDGTDRVPGIFVMGIREAADDTTNAIRGNIRWVAGATGDAISADNIAFVESAATPLAIIGGNFSCRFSYQLDATFEPALTIEPALCENIEPFVAALEVPSATLTPPSFNENWAWALNASRERINGLNEQLAGLTVTPSGLIYGATRVLSEAARILNDLTQLSDPGGSPLLLPDTSSRVAALEFYETDGFLRAVDNQLLDNPIALESHGVAGEYPDTLNRPASGAQMLVLSADTNSNNSSDTTIALAPFVDLSSLDQPMLEFYHTVRVAPNELSECSANRCVYRQVMVRTEQGQTGFSGFDEITERDGTFVPGTAAYTTFNGASFFRGLQSCVDTFTDFFDRLNCQQSNGDFIGPRVKTVIDLSALKKGDGTDALEAQIAFKLEKNGALTGTNPPQWLIDDIRIYDAGTTQVALETDFEMTGLRDGASTPGAAAQPWAFVDGASSNLTGFRLETRLDREDRRLGISSPLDLTGAIDPELEVCHRIGTKEAGLDIAGGVIEVRAGNGRWERAAPSAGLIYGTLEQGLFGGVLDRGKNALVYEDQLGVLQHDQGSSSYNSLVKINDNLYAVAFRGRGFDDFIKTFSVSPDRRYIRQIDLVRVDGANNSYDNSLVHLGGGLLALHFVEDTSAGGARRKLKTFRVGADGQISVLNNGNSFQVVQGANDPGRTGYGSLAVVDNDTVALAYRRGPGGRIATFDINTVNGAITLVEELDFGSSVAHISLIRGPENTAGTNTTQLVIAYGEFGTSILDIDDKGLVKTLRVNNDGTGIEETQGVTEWEYDSNGLTRFNALTRYGRLWFALTYRQSGGGAILKTFRVDSVGFIIPTDTNTGDAIDGDEIPIDTQATQRDMQDLAITSLSDSQVLVTGEILSGSNNSLVRSFRVFESSNTAAVPGQAIEGVGDIGSWNDIVTVDENTALRAYAGPGGDGFFKLYDRSLRGDDATSAFVGTFPGGHRADLPCQTSIVDLTPYIGEPHLRFRLRFVTSLGDQFANSLNLGWHIGSLTVRDKGSLADPSDDRVLLSTEDDNGVNGSIFRLSDTSRETPTIASFDLPSAVDTGGLVSSGNTTLYLAGALDRSVNIGNTGQAGPGAFVASLDLASFDTPNWSWLTAGSSGRFADLTTAGDAIIAAGSFEDSFTLPSASRTLTGSAGRIAGMLTSLDASDGSLTFTNAEPPLPWLLGGNGDVSGVSTGFSLIGVGTDVELRAVHSDGLGRVSIGGVVSNPASGATATIGTTPFSGLAGSDGFATIATAGGQAVTGLPWLVGRPIPAPDPGRSYQIPEFYRNGIRFDALQANIFYFEQRSSAGPAALTPLAATDDPVEIEWNELGVVGNPTRESQTIDWPSVPCTVGIDPARVGDHCYQAHVAGAPVELAAPGFQFQALTVPPNEASEAAVDQISEVFQATLDEADDFGYSVVRYQNQAAARPTFEVIFSYRASAAGAFQWPTKAQVGEEIKAPPNREHQPGRSGYVLDPLAYVDTTAYDAASRSGQIIPVNVGNPTLSSRSNIDVAWYSVNPKGVYWPAVAERYTPHWPGEAGDDSLIISRIDFAAGCGAPLAIDLHHAGLTGSGQVDLRNFELQITRDGTMPTTSQRVDLAPLVDPMQPGIAARISPKATFPVTSTALASVSLCRNGIVELVRKPQGTGPADRPAYTVDQFGHALDATALPWVGGPITDMDFSLQRADSVCSGARNRVNEFNVGLEWLPATGVPGSHGTDCNDRIIIASQAGGEVGGRDFPSTMLISQYIEDGPPVTPPGEPETGQDQLIEVFNGTGAPVDLSDYLLRIVAYNSSGVEESSTNIALSGSLNASEAYVIAHPRHTLADRGLFDLVTTQMNIDGNDRIELIGPGNIPVDVFGDDQPVGPRWFSGGVGTTNTNLTRSVRSCSPNPSSSGPFEPDMDWEVNALSETSDVGQHATDCIIRQAPLDAAEFFNWQIYVQNDPTRMGFNPNDEHALSAASAIGSGVAAVYALRADFGSNIPGNTAAFGSEPNVLVRFEESTQRQNLGSGRYGYRIYAVDAIAQASGYTDFRFDATAGQQIRPPYPLSTLSACQESRVEGEAPNSREAPLPFFRDYTGQLWARAETDDRDANIFYWYPRRADFYYDDVSVTAPGTCIPWMARLAPDNAPTIPTSYRVQWPAQTPLLKTGETLIGAKNGLPEIRNQASVKVVYDGKRDTDLAFDPSNPDRIFDFSPEQVLVEYFNPMQSRRLSAFEGLDGLQEIELPDGTRIRRDPDTGLQILEANADGYKLPFSLRSRLRYDDQNRDLIFSGFFRDFSSGPQLLPNILTECEARHLMAFPDLGTTQPFVCDTTAADPDTDWARTIRALTKLTRDPQEIGEYCRRVKYDANKNLVCDGDPEPAGPEEILVGYQDGARPDDKDGVLERYVQSGIPGALSAGAAATEGFVTLALNDDPQLGEPVSLEIFRVGCLAFDVGDQYFRTPYQGQVQLIDSDGVFDDKLTLRHSGDFAGRLDRVEFQWCIRADADSTAPTPPDAFGSTCLDGWTEQPSGGLPQITLQGTDPRALGDNWVVARYKIRDPAGNLLCTAPDTDANGRAPDNSYSAFAGGPGGLPPAPQAQLAQGWIKRVLDRLNPFDTRVRDFHSGPTNTVASLISQLGQRYEGNTPLITTRENLNSLGLIEAYETVLRRALDFVFGDNVEPQPEDVRRSANNAILLISTRLLDLYAVLGNEAYADAQDPLVGLSRLGLGTIATEAFSFENRLPSLLEEELVLLRGRDPSQGPVTSRPTYNRLEPNFTGSTGQAAYQTAYNVSDQTGPDGVPDSIIDEQDALALYPQGHGDAWGHFLQALNYHYDLLNSANFDWQPRSESVLINNGPLPVDYLDERKFADIAAIKARVGAQVLDLTYRSEYTEDPNGQWQGYQDADLSRQWGVSGWASRAGRGAYFDWVTANSILPEEHESLAIDPEFLFGTDSTAGFCQDHPGDPVCTCVANNQGGCASQIRQSPDYRQDFCAAPINAGNAYCECLPTNDPTAQGGVACPMDYAPTGLQVIDRTTVDQLAEIADQYVAIQSKIDEIDRGLNPLGIARDAVPFDIDPSRVDANETHFEQVAGRAENALENAAKVWDFANRLTALLRFNQDDVEDLRENAREADIDFRNRLVAIYGTPFPSRIGAGEFYPDGYQGPDLKFFYEIARESLEGTGLGPLDDQGNPIDISPGGNLSTIEGRFFNVARGESWRTNCPDEVMNSNTNVVELANDCSGLVVPAQPAQVDVQLTALTGPDTALQFVNSGAPRRVSGKLQEAYYDQINARLDLATALASYNALIGDIDGTIEQFTETFRIQAEQVEIRRQAGARRIGLSVTRNALQVVADQIRAVSSITTETMKASATCPPLVVGPLAVDALSGIRCSIKLGAVASTAFEEFAAAQFGIVANQIDLAIQEVGAAAEVSVQATSNELELLNLAGSLSGLIQREPAARLEAVSRGQALASVQRTISNLLAEGDRLQAAQARFNRLTASETSEYRFQDIAFRQFRNDVVQKYRATFDLAARFVYLAAKAYDYETNLLSEDSRAGRVFLTDIVRHRSIGQLLDGLPIPGSNGLSDSLARMKANFEVLKGQMGFNNPQVETNRFSLRRALFDIPDPDEDGYVAARDERRWQDQLASMRYLDINRAIDPVTGEDYGAALRRFARPFAEVGVCPQPGIIIPFSSAVISGKNFFGSDLEARDSAYDASQFSTRIRGVGAWFDEFDTLTLGVSETPRVYLLPIGDDVLRPADGSSFATRGWNVIDQKIPVPFPIGDNDIAQPDFSPLSDSLSDGFTLERKIGRFRAYDFDETGFDQEFSTDSRLIGRSVWNTRWLFVIPGATFLADPDEGLDRFIYGENVNGVDWRDNEVRGNYAGCQFVDGAPKQSRPSSPPGGIKDILLFFRTYAYSGN